MTDRQRFRDARNWVQVVGLLLTLAFAVLMLAQWKTVTRGAPVVFLLGLVITALGSYAVAYAVLRAGGMFSIFPLAFAVYLEFVELVSHSSGDFRSTWIGIAVWIALIGGLLTLVRATVVVNRERRRDRKELQARFGVPD